METFQNIIICVYSLLHIFYKNYIFGDSNKLFFFDFSQGFGRMRPGNPIFSVMFSSPTIWHQFLVLQGRYSYKVAACTKGVIKDAYI